MASFGSPKVTFEEIDKTAVITDVGGRTAGVSILSTWGPTGKSILVSDMQSLETIFGKANTTNAEYYLNIQSIFYYSNAVRVSRIATGHLNATSDGTGILIPNFESYESSYENFQGAVGTFSARYPGKKGNSIKVEICPPNSTAFDGWDYKGLFSSAPSTSGYASARGGSLDQIHVVVIDVNGEFSPNRGTVLEKYENLSLASDGKGDDGSVSYYKDVLTRQSNYVYLMDHPTTFTNAGTLASGTTFVVGTAIITSTLSGGTSDDAPTAGEIEASYDIFANKAIKIYCLTAPPLPTGADGSAIGNYILGIASTRKDCFAIIAPPTASVSNVSNLTAHTNIISFAEGLNSTKEGVLGSCAVRMRDYTNSKDRWVTSSGHLTGLMLTTGQTFDSPAGIENGIFRRVSEISYSPTDAQKDELYNARVNPIVTEAGVGIYLRGDKTLYSPNTLFRKIDVRGLMILVETAVTAYAETLLFKRNSTSTANLFVQNVETFLSTVRDAEGISDFTVTTPVSSDPSTFRGNIYLKPITSINYVELQFIATPANVSFEEIINA